MAETVTNALDQQGLVTLVNDIRSSAVKTINISGTTLTYTLMDGTSRTCTIEAADKAGTSTVGGTAQPIYLNSGNPTACKVWTSGSNYGVAVIKEGGVMEIGKYIDFHDDDTTTADYSTRITSNNGSLVLGSATVGGTANPVYLKAGTLTACGTAAQVSAATSSSSGYVKFSNGILIQWGSCTAGNTTTFPVSYSGTPRVTATHTMASTNGACYYFGIYITNTTFFIKDNLGYTDQGTGWIAVGPS